MNRSQYSRCQIRPCRSNTRKRCVDISLDRQAPAWLLVSSAVLPCPINQSRIRRPLYVFHDATILGTDHPFSGSIKTWTWLGMTTQANKRYRSRSKCSQLSTIISASSGYCKTHDPCPASRYASMRCCNASACSVSVNCKASHWACMADRARVGKASASL